MTISKYLALSIFVSLNLLVNTCSTAQNTNSKTSKKKQGTSLTSYEKYIDDNNDAHLKEFIELVSIPSISTPAIVHSMGIVIKVEGSSLNGLRPEQLN